MSEEFPTPGSIATSIAATKRHNPKADLTERYRELHKAKLAKYVLTLKRSWPALTEEQADEICALIRGRLDD